jgi:hypothetical protein
VQLIEESYQRKPGPVPLGGPFVLDRGRAATPRRRPAADNAKKWAIWGAAAGDVVGIIYGLIMFASSSSFM